MSIPFVNIAQMREWENATWAAGQTESEVIRRVGLAIARRALELTRSGDAILVLAGKGHNGDDARFAREHLTDRRVESIDVISPGADLAKLDQALLQKPALIIDGLFGIGLNQPLDAAWIAFVQRLNAARAVILAVDVPSGLDADSGKPLGAAVEAAITLTVGAPKTGLLAESAWPFVGRLEVTPDVGLSPCPHQTGLNWSLPQDFLGYPPRRSVAGHKGTYGHAILVAGSFGYHGAAVLAARGAQRAQPGLVTVLTYESVYHPVASQLQSPMVNLLTKEMKLPETATSLLIGPGLAAAEFHDDMKAVTRRHWRYLSMPIVVDASALEWMETSNSQNDAIRVITPHPGEAARMLNATVAQIQGSRAQALRELSRRLGNCWVVLKGHQTLIGRSTGEIFVNSSGNPWLAQGGSGDALAGFITGLLAQPDLQREIGLTLRYAVWRHGAAADTLQQRAGNWSVEDLIDELGRTPGV